MDEHPALRELDLGALLVRVTWIGSIFYVVANIAYDIERFNTARKLSENATKLTADMLNDSGSGYTLAYMLATLAAHLVYALGFIVGAYVLRTLIWIAVRHGAVPGQVMPEEDSTSPS